MEWRIGCSGFHYPEWKNVFYPPGLAQKNWFNYYCQHFNTLELNMTFYRFPTVNILRNWYEKSPAHFTFSVKAPRLITHYKKFNDSKRLLDDFYGAIKEGLGEKLGAALFQLPRQVIYSDDWLQRIIQSMDPAFENVVEFRHDSWWKKKVFKQMAKHDIIFSSTSYPGLPEDLVVNSHSIYYRLHGREKLYYSSYPLKFLQAIGEEAQSHKKLKHAYFYFDNTAEGHAIINAKQLQGIVKGGA